MLCWLSLARQMKRHCGDSRSDGRENVKESDVRGTEESFLDVNQLDGMGGAALGGGGFPWLLKPPGRWVVEV